MKLKNCDIDQFYKIIQERPVICFGAGKGLNNFLDLFYEYNIINRIECIVDNDLKKTGTKFEYTGNSVPIISFEQFCKIANNRVVLITTLNYIEIYNQIESSRIPCDVYIYRYIISESNSHFWKSESNIFNSCSSEIIPKVIHYCWFGKNDLSDLNKECLESWKRYCPDYEIIQWDESNYNFKDNKYAYEAYKNEKWAYVADVARFDIMYKYGGIYLDTDVEVLRCLDTLRMQKGFFGTFFSGEINSGLGFGAIPKQKIILQLKNMYDEYQFTYSENATELQPCTQKETYFFEKKGYKKRKGYQNIEGFSIYTNEVLQNICWDTGRTFVSEKTYTIHHSNSSWRSNKDKEKMHQNYLFWMNHLKNCN